MKVALSFLLGLALWGQDSQIVGKSMAPVKLADTAGRETTMSFQDRITAVLFVSTRCPVSNDYNLRMKELYKAYGSRVQFVFVNANANEPASEVAQHIQEAGFPFAVWKGSDAVTDAFHASFTPEAFVIDRSGAVRYHGAIDDARNPARVTKTSLKEALEAVLAGQPVTTPETKAFGCTIKRARKDS